MREIRFRGKQIDTGEWIEGGLDTDWGLPSEQRTRYWIIKPYYGSFAVVPETIGQYIGRTDKNGSKIFEGDIFNAGVKNCVFWFDETENAFVYGCSFGDGYRMSTATYATLDTKEIKIIGNVYDNPELLDGGNNG